MELLELVLGLLRSITKFIHVLQFFSNFIVASQSVEFTQIVEFTQSIESTQIVEFTQSVEFT